MTVRDISCNANVCGTSERELLGIESDVKFGGEKREKRPLH